MSTKTYSAQTVLRVAAGLTLGLFALTFIVAPLSASAAVYGYVDAKGEVKSVTAVDWMTAIATAPNIHINSGVMLLLSAADYLLIGGSVQAAK